MNLSKRISVQTALLIVLGLLIAQALVLWHEGRILICACGYVLPWYAGINGSGNSQHLSDWYTLSHIIHGFLFYALLRYLTPKLPVHVRLIIAVLIEALWEIAENGSFVINRYRAVTASWGYVGDSIVNSLGDTLSAAFGFLLAYKLPVWAVILIGIAFELIALYFVRDNLTLNVLMLAFPLESVKQWQLAM
jgi:hypothetical protein